MDETKVKGLDENSDKPLGLPGELFVNLIERLVDERPHLKDKFVMSASSRLAWINANTVPNRSTVAEICDTLFGEGKGKDDPDYQELWRLRTEMERTVPPTIGVRRANLLEKVSVPYGARLDGLKVPVIPLPCALLDHASTLIDDLLQWSARTDFVLGRSNMLIFGELGSGKTIALHSLGQRLVDEAKKSDRNQMPILVEIPTWPQYRDSAHDKGSEISFEGWLRAVLIDSYRLPAVEAEAWLINPRATFLLDSYDEMADTEQVLWIQALLDFLRTTVSKARFIICSRPRPSILALRERQDFVTLELRDLQREQILVYLDHLDEPLEPLRNLAAEQWEEFAKSLARPLNMILAIKFVLRDEHSDQSNGDNVLQHNDPSLEQLKKHLKELERIIRDEKNRAEEVQKALNIPRVKLLLEDVCSASSYQDFKVCIWLSWIAINLQPDGADFRLTSLQPKHLPTQHLRIIYTVLDRLGLGVVLGIMQGLWFGLVVAGYGLQQQMPTLYWAYLPGDMLTWALLGLLVGSLFSGHPKPIGETQHATALRISMLAAGAVLVGMVGLLATGALTGLVVFGILGGAAGAISGWPGIGPRQIVPVRLRRFDWRRAVRLAPSLVIGTTLLGWVLGYYSIDVSGLLGTLLPSPQAGALTGALSAVGFSIIVSLVDTDFLKESETPYQRLYHSGYTAAQAGVIGAVIGSLIGVLTTDGQVTWLILSLISAMLAATAVGGSAITSHFLLRLVLWSYGCIPWHLGEFLKVCAQHELLLWTGSGYKFSHSTIKEIFLEPGTFAKPVQPSQARLRFLKLLSGAIVLVAALLVAGNSVLGRERVISITNPRPSGMYFVLSSDSGSRVLSYPTPLTSQGEVRLTAQGRIELGALTGSTDAGGMWRGLLGLPLNPSFLEDHRYPFGALLCKVASEPSWHLCGPATTLIMSDTDQLEFQINDRDSENNQGAYLIAVDAVSP